MKNSDQNGIPKGQFFLMPDSIFMIGLEANELAVYAYLRKCVNNKTYQCWPSFATIAKATDVSKSTVKRCVDSLTEKGCIRTERIYRQAKNGSLLNGSLMYTLNSPQEMLDRFYEKYGSFLSKQYWKKRIFWSDGYFACSIGEVSSATIQKYIENQG